MNIDFFNDFILTNEIFSILMRIVFAMYRKNNIESMYKIIFSNEFLDENVEIKFYKCNFKYQTQVITYRTLKKCTRNFISKCISQNSYSIICFKCLLYNNNSHYITHFKKVYRSLDCLSQDLSVLLSGKGLPQKKRNNISPGAPSGSCLSLSPFFRFAGGQRKGRSGAMNEKKETQSIARMGRRNSRCVIDRNGIIGVRFLRRQQCECRSLRKGQKAQVTLVVVSSSCFRHRK